MVEGYVSLKDALSKLSAASERLNESSDSLNELIQSLEERLADSNVGIRLWDIDLLDHNEEPGEEEGEVFLEGYRIGYEKHGEGGWRILYKRVRSWTDRHGDEHEIDLGRPQPLLNAPRHVRMLAAGRLEPLVEALAGEAERYAASVEKAKGVFKSDERKMPALELALQQDLCERISHQAEWREEKAAEYPDDLRNQESAVALRKLAKKIEQLPYNHPKLVRLNELLIAAGADELQTYTAGEAELLRIVGFHRGGGAEPQNAESFLERLIELLEDARKSK